MHATVDLQPVSDDQAEGAIADIFEQIRGELGFVPNLFRNMAVTPALLETYLEGYRQFREHSELSPPEQEVVLLSISRFNGCRYCMAAHSMMADKVSKVPADVLAAIREGGDIPDARLKALSLFTLHLVEQRGVAEPSELEAFEAAGFEHRHVMDILLAISIKTLSNYTNHLFETGVDDAFADYAWDG